MEIEEEKPETLLKVEGEPENGNDEGNSTLLTNTNRILSSVGIAFKQIISLEELVRVAPSMFVAVVESLYKIKIDGIIRNPQTKADYVNNAQLMINSLGEQLKVDISYITGLMIVEGNKEALTNLVNIFMRLLSLSGANGSMGSLGSNLDKEENDFNRRFSYPSVDSISTKDSLLLPKHSSTGPRQKKHSLRGDMADYKKVPYYQQSPEQRFAQKFLTNSLHKGEKLLNYDLKQVQANRRRKLSQNYENSIVRARNQVHKLKVRKFQQEKWKKEQKSEMQSWDMKTENEEIVALHRIYNHLFREAVRRKAEERKEENLRVHMLKSRLQDEVEALDKLYREKLQMVDEQINVQRDQFLKSEFEEVVNELSSKLQSSLSKQQSGLTQNRARELQWKREACQQLLLSVHGTKWEDFLRVHPAQKSRRNNKT